MWDFSHPLRACVGHSRAIAVYPGGNGCSTSVSSPLNPAGSCEWITLMCAIWIPGRRTHFSPHPVHPRHHVCFMSAFTHHPRVLNRLQRSGLALGVRSAILVPRRNQSFAISTLHRSDTSARFVRRLFRGGGHQCQMGSVAYTGILGYRE